MPSFTKGSRNRPWSHLWLLGNAQSSLSVRPWRDRPHITKFCASSRIAVRCGSMNYKVADIIWELAPINGRQTMVVRVNNIWPSFCHPNTETKMLTDICSSAAKCWRQAWCGEGCVEFFWIWNIQPVAQVRVELLHLVVLSPAVPQYFWCTVSLKLIVFANQEKLCCLLSIPSRPRVLIRSSWQNSTRRPQIAWNDLRGRLT